MNGIELRALSEWGGQGGLLSPREVDELMRVVSSVSGAHVSVLEVGHYYGLSTCALVHALSSNLHRTWSLLTVDAHIADMWVPETDPAVFFANKRKHFDDPRVQVLIADSRSIQRLDGFDVVFYDGDHAEEQRRFTQLVIDSPHVTTYIYDDADFVIPVECAAMLRNAGWIDGSPALCRGADDKRNPDTMTLAIWRRPDAYK
jgi:hypothetical protein